jgi:hypothetical protein
MLARTLVLILRIRQNPCPASGPLRPAQVDLVQPNVAAQVISNAPASRSPITPLQGVHLLAVTHPAIHHYHAQFREPREIPETPSRPAPPSRVGSSTSTADPARRQLREIGSANAAVLPASAGSQSPAREYQRNAKLNRRKSTYPIALTPSMMGLEVRIY